MKMWNMSVDIEGINKNHSFELNQFKLSIKLQLFMFKINMSYVWQFWPIFQFETYEIWIANKHDLMTSKATDDPYILYNLKAKSFPNSLHYFQNRFLFTLQHKWSFMLIDKSDPVFNMNDDFLDSKT